MHVHRTARTRFFTTLGNEVLRDNRLSFCARGILGHLLSFPDGQRGDIRTLAERTPEGRERVASALRELERLGYLKREVKRTTEGRLFTEVDVFDTPGGPTPQAAPNPDSPGSSAPQAAPDDDHPSKEKDETTTPPPSAQHDPGRQGSDDQETAASAQLLARVTRAEPKLPLGRTETLRLAPLVTEWRRRGASDLHIVNTLTIGLPPSVHHPARFIETRLRTKLPAEPAAPPTRLECDECRAPVVVAGPCRACRQPEPACQRTSTEFVQRLTRGAALGLLTK